MFFRGSLNLLNSKKSAEFQCLFLTHTHTQTGNSLNVGMHEECDRCAVEKTTLGEEFDDHM